MKDRYNPRMPGVVDRQRASTRRTAAQRRNATIELAIAALGFIAADRQELARFPALTGIDPSAIRVAHLSP
jgi:hypothetical protein